MQTQNATQHPIYAKARAGAYITVTDLAALIRSALKRAFPATKFSVRSSSYSGGSSVSVKWTDGPTAKDVDVILNQYETRGFDGMIDLAHSYDLWIYPDGSAHVAHGEGTTGSGGTVSEVIESARSGDAVLLSNVSSSFISGSRSISADLIRKGIEAVKAKNWVDLDGFDWSRVQIIEDSEFHSAHLNSTGQRLNGEWLENEIYRRAREITA